MSQICKYCGAPIEKNIDKCPYCRISYIKPIRTVDANFPYFDITIGKETIRTYVADIQDCSIIESSRDVHGYVKGAVVRPRCRKITLVEV